MLHRASTLAVFAALAPLAAAGTIESITDDFTDGSFDAFFSYDFSSDFGVNFNSIDASGLLLASDEVLITFPGTGPAGRVLEVNVVFTDFTGVGATTFEATGLNGIANDANDLVSTSEQFGASFTLIGDIQSVRINAFETFITSITVRYEVPAPAGAGVLAAAGLLAARRRRA